MPYVTAVPGVRLFSSCCKQSPLASSFSIMEKEPAQVRLHANWTVTRTASVVVEFCEAYSRLEHVFMWRITVTNGLTSPLDVIKYQNIHEKDILHLTASLNWTDTFLFVFVAETCFHIQFNIVTSTCCFPCRSPIHGYILYPAGPAAVSSDSYVSGYLLAGLQHAGDHHWEGRPAHVTRVVLNHL